VQVFTAKQNLSDAHQVLQQQYRCAPLHAQQNQQFLQRCSTNCSQPWP
jgi:hypothetical protein